MPDRSQRPEDLMALLEDAVVGIFRSTPEGAFLWINLALARLFGYDSVESVEQVVSFYDAPNSASEKDFEEMAKVKAELAANLAIYNSEKLFGVPVVIWRKADGRADMMIGVPSDAQIQIMLKEVK